MPAHHQDTPRQETLWHSPFSDRSDPQLRIIVTGGTFDKRYDAISGELGFAGTHLPDILQRVRCAEPVMLEINQLIDSRDMQPENHASIVESCRRSPQQHIVVTHGTDRMQHTARALSEAALSRVIVLTGAMVPYSVAGSDSLFNLGTAMAAVRILPPGVYVAMNGQVFCGAGAVKDPRQGVFIGRRLEKSTPEQN